MSGYHTPVLLEESINSLIINPSGTYADVTFGGGGHTARLLSRLHEDGHVIAFDRDSDALANRIDDPRLTLVRADFRFIRNFVLLQVHKAEEEKRTGTEACSNGNAGASAEAEAGAGAGGVDGNKAAEKERTGAEADSKAEAGARPGDASAGTEGEEKTRAVNCWAEGLDGILADLGVSSHQFDTAERGFSFRYDSPLDMRMNREGGITAETVVNEYSQSDLERIFRLYGEVDNARRLAQLIVSARAQDRIVTTGDLGRAIAPAVPKIADHKYLAKVYQALRIEVNHEMKSLEKFLEGAAEALKPGGRLVVITYHSLEDRMVKNFIRTGNVDGVQEKDMYGNLKSPFRAVNRKPILPEEEEIASNTRARSAKLRVAEKLESRQGEREVGKRFKEYPGSQGERESIKRVKEYPDSGESAKPGRE